TKKAGVDVALASYYFGPKIDLFRQVLTRRLDEHVNDISTALDAAVAAAGDRPPSVDAMIRAFITPVLDKLAGGDEGWRNYIHLLAYLSNTQQQLEFTQPMNEAVDPYVRR